MRRELQAASPDALDASSQRDAQTCARRIDRLQCGSALLKPARTWRRGVLVGERKHRRMTEPPWVGGLERPSERWPYVEEGKPGSAAAQPFVRTAHHHVRVEHLYVNRQDANGLVGVENDDRSVRLCCTDHRTHIQ